MRLGNEDLGMRMRREVRMEHEDKAYEYGT